MFDLCVYASTTIIIMIGVKLFACFWFLFEADALLETQKNPKQSLPITQFHVFHIKLIIFISNYLFDCETPF